MTYLLFKEICKYVHILMRAVQQHCCRNLLLLHIEALAIFTNLIFIMNEIFFRTCAHHTLAMPPRIHCRASADRWWKTPK